VVNAPSQTVWCYISFTSFSLVNLALQQKHVLIMMKS